MKGRKEEGKEVGKEFKGGREGWKGGKEGREGAKKGGKRKY